MTRLLGHVLGWLHNERALTMASIFQLTNQPGLSWRTRDTGTTEDLRRPSGTRRVFPTASHPSVGEKLASYRSAR